MGMNPEDIVKYPWTDIGARMLFADFYKETLRYMPERKSWFFYEDGIWLPSQHPERCTGR